MRKVLTKEFFARPALLVAPDLLGKYIVRRIRYNGLIAAKKSDLWFEDRGAIVDPIKIVATPRIGVDYAGPIWAPKLYRFLLRG